MYRKNLLFHFYFVHCVLRIVMHFFYDKSINAHNIIDVIRTYFVFKIVINFQVNTRTKLIYQVCLFGYYYIVHKFLGVHRINEKSVEWSHLRIELYNLLKKIYILLMLKNRII